MNVSRLNRVIENMQAQGAGPDMGAAGPDMSGASSSANDDVIDGDFREV